MGDCFFEGRPAQRKVTRFSPPLDRRLVEPCVGKVMGDELRLGRGKGRKLVAQDFGDVLVYDLPAAL